MRKLLKFLLVSTLVLVVGVPAAFLLFVFGMTALGVAIGVGGAIIGLMLGALKLALMIVLPLLLAGWLVKRLFGADRTC
jgi:hypothetical protein